MKLSDLRGDATLDPNAAIAFVTHWFRATDLITIVGRRAVAQERFNTLSQSMTAAEFVQNLHEPDALQSLVFDSEDGSCWNLYVGVCPVTTPSQPTQRGTEDNVFYVPGVWADIDVKPGSFESTEEILQFLQELPLQPTIICGSGSGGVHAYWRMHWDRAADKSLVEEWWSFLAERAGERSIDKLIDVTRILRIPGTINFPKQTGQTEPGKMRPVVLHQATGRTYSPEEVRAIAADAYARRKERRKRIIEQDQQRRVDMAGMAKQLLSGVNHGRWRLMRAVAYVEDIVNEKYTWDDILTPYGWTYLRQLRDGSHEWARPGRMERSAVCDFEDSPVMSLLSSSEETGLSDLKDAGVPLTRYRVMLRLHYGDDAEALLNDVLNARED